jgi:hypothetical protein
MTRCDGCLIAVLAVVLVVVLALHLPIWGAS